MQNHVKKETIIRTVENFCFPLLLFVYPLIHVCYGVEWRDTGYNYANFVYIDRMDPMWKFSTYLSNVVGNFLTRLPYGDCMLGLNIYTGLTVCVLALWGYFFFTKEVRMPSLPVFVGEIIAIGLCWCPTALLYNYLTYLLLFAAVFCLYHALLREKNGWFVAAGIAVGLNVFVRFSNLAQIALIAGVWVYGILQKKKAKKIFSWTLWCIMGFLLGFGSIFLTICVKYGAGEYFSSISRLMGMSAEADSYSVMSMVEMQIRNYLQNFLWMARMVPFCLIGVLGFAVLPKRLLKLKKAGYLFCMALVFHWLRNQNMFNYTYTTIMSVFQWGVCLLSILLVVGIYTVFSKKSTEQEKLLCGFSILIVLLTPLGSNNHLYSAINNLFFAAPVVLWMLLKLLRRIPERKVWKRKGREFFLYSYPFKGLVAMIVAMLLLQSLLFGFTFVFVESDGGKNLHTKVENSRVLKGMYTDEFHGRNLEELLSYVQENGLTGEEVILYGNIPSLSYYLEMPFAISPWPDLSSYNYSVMCADLETVRERIQSGEKAPVILLDASCGERMQEALDGEETEEKKLALIAGLIEDFGYELKFENSKFMLFSVG